MNNELSGMKAFVTVAELGSFSKAAEVLNLTQPALTRKIKKIESNLNTALFVRMPEKSSSRRQEQCCCRKQNR